MTDDLAPPPFPERIRGFSQRLHERLDATLDLLGRVRADEALLAATLEAAVQTAEAIARGATLFICGNGGSAGEATHLSGELIGPFLDKGRRPLPAIALGFDTSATSAVANDFSFDEIFARPLAALARPGDVLWALSTSGRSPNVRRALETAADKGMLSVLLTGARHADLPPQADIVLAVPSRETPRIQEMHLVLGHFLCEVVESLNLDRGRVNALHDHGQPEADHQ
ncbi:D-sedoheptulose-7-phosphate isomerase [Thermochromatium tepidum]|uniref:D-sedoheptulose-7-phosphate isomerase n=1 Tax=Thermochromatium tepidum TaxID=1050 RepID=UPI001FE6E53E|nr:SIS domain-containing protein [Thermochromatium tepidum]